MLFVGDCRHDDHAVHAAVRAVLDVERGVARKSYGPERIDAYTGAFFSNLIAYFIIVATAATLHQAGQTEIDSAAEAAQALAPVAGHTRSCCSRLACSARRCWRPGSCRSRPPTRWPRRSASARASTSTSDAPRSSSGCSAVWSSSGRWRGADARPARLRAAGGDPGAQRAAAAGAAGLHAPPQRRPGVDGRPGERTEAPGRRLDDGARYQRARPDDGRQPRGAGARLRPVRPDNR